MLVAEAAQALDQVVPALKPGKEYPLALERKYVHDLRSGR